MYTTNTHFFFFLNEYSHFDVCTDQSRERRDSDIVEPERARTSNRLRRQTGTRRFESGPDGAEQLLQERDTSFRLLRPEGNAHIGRWSNNA